MAEPARIDTAMVFAAGLGTRMRPVTDALPKPLVEVGGKTMLDHMLDRLDAAGVERAVVNVHYRADQIERSLETRTRPAITVSDERALLLDQGGGIAHALPMLGAKPFFICNTDAVWMEGPASNLRRLAADWDGDRMDILLLVASTATSVGVDWPGDFLMDGSGRLIKRGESDVAPFVYAGVGILKPDLFDGITDPVFKLAPFFFEAAKRGRLYGTRLDGIWLHVGTPEAIEEAETVLSTSAV